jgi:NADP-dependent 3-hydroxy acid dehydrogenase YdfG
MRLSRQHVGIVTGASSGIGRQTALLLARKGVRVVLAARNARLLEECAQEIRSGGGSAVVLPTDVTDPAGIGALVKESMAQWGRIDLCVCCAGAYIRGRIQDATREDLEASIRVNYLGSALLVREVLPHMLARGSGHVVAVTSVDGKKGLPLDGPYVAAKAAMTGFMDVLRQELRGTGVGVSTVLPGRVDTPMIAHLRVPLVSAKISAARVARAVVRAIEADRAEIVIPFAGPKTLIVVSALCARAGDFLTRLFRLEGDEIST